MINKPVDIAQPISTIEKWTILVCLLGTALVAGYALLAHGFNSEEWMSWFFLLCLGLFPILALASLASIIKGWSIEQEDNAFRKIIGHMIIAPFVLYIVLIVFALVLWLTLSTIVWSTSIPF